jgi:hypothetical protein
MQGPAAYPAGSISMGDNVKLWLAFTVLCVLGTIALVLAALLIATGAFDPPQIPAGPPL